MIVIIGGGIIGLSIGWYLARAGRAVTVLERGQAGQEATWASGGVLAPWSYAEGDVQPLVKLQQEGYALWPDFRRELEADAEMEIDYRAGGLLIVALGAEDEAWLRAHYEFQHSVGNALEWLTGEEVTAREPLLSDGIVAATFGARDHQIENRKAAQALRRALLCRRGMLRENAAVQEIVIKNGRVQSVRLTNESLAAEIVILAAGAWSGSIAGLPQTVRPPVRPIKGQMLALQMPLQAPMLRHMVLGLDTYLIPRNDGRLLVGATVEDTGFDLRVTAGGIQEHLSHALTLLPAAQDLEIVEMWAGVRPGSPDGAPIIGSTEVVGLLMATGHYRNGILLAPLTARAICSLVLTGETPEYVKAFSLARFG